MLFGFNWRYIPLFSGLFAIEAYIALYVHDDFIRPYIGDVLVVPLMYAFLRIFMRGVRILPWYLFLFAFLIEVGQYYHLADALHIENRVLRMLLGSTYDQSDIACYLWGTLALVIGERAVEKRREKRA